MSNCRLGFCFMVMVLLGTFLLSNVDAQTESWNMTVKGGLLFPGTVNVDPPGWDFDSETG